MNGRSKKCRKGRQENKLNEMKWRNGKTQNERHEKSVSTTNSTI